MVELIVQRAGPSGGLNMDIDQEFFSIVEQLGPLGELKLRSLETPANPGQACGCGPKDEQSGGCCSSTPEDEAPAL